MQEEGSSELSPDSSLGICGANDQKSSRAHSGLEAQDDKGGPQHPIFLRVCWGSSVTLH